MDSLLEGAQNQLLRLRKQKENPDKRTLRIPVFAVTELQRFLASRKPASIRHIYPLLDENIRPRAFELNLWRQLAKQGSSIERVYAVPHAGFARSSLHTCLEEDARSGLSTAVVTLSTIPLDQLIACVNQFIIADGQFVFRSDERSLGAGAQEQEWILSIKEEDIRHAMELWNTLVGISSTTAIAPRNVDLEEPLVLSADLINGVADVLCSGDHVDRSDCSWYHGAWQYLRVLDLVSTPTWHDAFYRTAFEEAFSRNPCSRVLISGTADYSLLAYVLSSARKCNAAPDVTVLDQCGTPLFACRWFAKRFGTSIHTIQADVLDAPRLLGKFDLITSDAFLTRFPGGDVRRVAEVWSELLVPGGTAVTTVRLHGKSVAVRDEGQAVLDFVSRARVRLPRWQQFLRQPAQKLIAAVEVYGRRMVSNRIGEEQDILKMLATVGLRPHSTEVADVPGELYPTVYLRTVCKKSAAGEEA
jgi:hypothetical protein